MFVLVKLADRIAGDCCTGVLLCWCNGGHCWLWGIGCEECAEVTKWLWRWGKKVWSPAGRHLAAAGRPEKNRESEAVSGVKRGRGSSSYSTLCCRDTSAGLKLKYESARSRKLLASLNSFCFSFIVALSWCRYGAEYFQQPGLGWDLGRGGGEGAEIKYDGEHLAGVQWTWATLYLTWSIILTGVRMSLLSDIHIIHS